MRLPAAIRVFERGWLSCNNILLTGANDAGASAVLVDSSYIAHAAQTVALLRHALAGAPLDWLVNTHCHSDHMGGNAPVQRAFGCRTSLPAGEAALIERWDDREMLLTYADQRAERFAYDDCFADGDRLGMGGLAWEVIAAPGHDPHAVMFWCEAERILISGDALWQNGFGVIFPRLLGDAAGRDAAYAQTRATLERIAALPVHTVIPGHGAAFDDVPAALARAFKRLESFERRPAGLPRRRRPAHRYQRALFATRAASARRLAGDRPRARRRAKARRRRHRAAGRRLTAAHRLERAAGRPFPAGAPIQFSVLTAWSGSRPDAPHASAVRGRAHRWRCR